MAIHLEQHYGLPESSMGLYFGLPAIIYVLNTPMITCYTRCLSRRGVVLIGLIIIAIGSFLIGTSPLIHLPDETGYVLVGLCMYGFGGACITVPLLPEVIDTLEYWMP
mmetsp:Transcript_42269/g.57487  ORF Transcript_42269/g.57487 Transcript_42269/m.57487 type:complete len:108 (+) Transcript_42269:449-772(+)